MPCPCRAMRWVYKPPHRICVSNISTFATVVLARSEVLTVPYRYRGSAAHTSLNPRTLARVIASIYLLGDLRTCTAMHCDARHCTALHCTGTVLHGTDESQPMEHGAGRAFVSSVRLCKTAEAAVATAVDAPSSAHTDKSSSTSWNCRTPGRARRQGNPSPLLRLGLNAVSV